MLPSTFNRLTRTPGWAKVCLPSRVYTEVRTALGRIDAIVRFDTGIRIFEFKLDGGAEAALAGIREKDYAGPYRTAGKPVYLVGVGFDSEQ